MKASVRASEREEPAVGSQQTGATSIEVQPGSIKRNNI